MDSKQVMEHWWNDTDSRNWSIGRKTLYSVGGRWMNECGALVEWYWQRKLKYYGKNLFRWHSVYHKSRSTVPQRTLSSAAISRRLTPWATDDAAQTVTKTFVSLRWLCCDVNMTVSRRHDTTRTTYLQQYTQKDRQTASTIETYCTPELGFTSRGAYRVGLPSDTASRPRGLQYSPKQPRLPNISHFHCFH
jgi:hypothetical protein